MSTHVVVLWYHGARGRPFETLTDPDSRNPIAYSLNYLQKHHFRLFNASTRVSNSLELKSWTESILFPTVTKEKPLLVPLDLARSEFGWTDFKFHDGGAEE